MLGFYGGLFGLGQSVRAADCPHELPIGTLMEPAPQAYQLLDTELGRAVRSAIPVAYDVRPVGSQTPGEVVNRAAAMFMQFFSARWTAPRTQAAVLAEPCFYKLMNHMAPLQAKDSTKTAGDTVKVDPSKMTQNQLIALINSLAGSATDAYKQHLMIQLMLKAKNKEPVDVPATEVERLGLPRYVPWLVIGGLVVAGGIAYYLATRKRKSSAPSFEGPVIDVVPKQLPAPA